MRNLALVLSALAFGLAVVTAAVTFAHAQPGDYQVVVTNRATGKTLTYRRLWPDQNRCDAAIRGVTEALNSVAAMKIGPDGQIVGEMVPAPDADNELAASLDALLDAMFQNTGVFPNLSISCELQADPA